MENNTPLKRITLGSIWQYLTDIITFERGMFYTIRQLAIKPGKAIKNFLYEDRNRMVKPFRFLIYLVTISSLLSYYFIPFDTASIDPVLLEAIEQAEKQQNKDLSRLKNAFISMSNFAKSYINLIMLFNIPVLSIFSYFFYKKLNYNFAEHLVLNAFLIAFMNVISIVFILIQIANFSWSSSIMPFQQPLVIGYFVFAYFVFFNIPSLEGFLRAVGAIFCSTILAASLINSAIFYYFYQSS